MTSWKPVLLAAALVPVLAPGLPADAGSPPGGRLTACDVRRITRSDPVVDTSVNAPVSTARRSTFHGGRPPSAGSSKTSWMQSTPPSTTCGAKAA